MMCELKKQDLSYFPLNHIRPASENGLLYDGFNPQTDGDDAKLYWSIKAEGIREPLHISADGFILSGHRRYEAASWVGLSVVPCIVAEDVVFSDLPPDERINLLAVYNKQRDKSHAELLREAMLEIDPGQAYERLRQDRIERRQVDIEDNVTLGDYKGRARITTMDFLQAAQRVIESEKQFWPLTVRRVHYLLLNDPPLKHDRKTGSTYRNDLSSYKALTNLLLRARLTGDIPHAAIEDELRPIRAISTYKTLRTISKQRQRTFSGIMPGTFSGASRTILRSWWRRTLSESTLNWSPMNTASHAQRAGDIQA